MLPLRLVTCKHVAWPHVRMCGARHDADTYVRMLLSGDVSESSLQNVQQSVHYVLVCDSV